MFEGETVKERWRNLNRRTLLSVTGLLLTAACLAFVGYVVYRERDVLITHLLRANARQLLAVVAWYVADLAIFIGGWASIMAGLGGRLSLARHARIFCLANAAKRLPGTLWYIGGRAALYGRAGIPSRTVVVASAVEGALIWLAGLAICVPFLMVALPDRRWVWLGAGGLVLAGLLNPRTLRWVLQRATRDGGGTVISLPQVYGWLLLYMAGWAVGGILLFAILTIFQVPTLDHLPTVIGTWTVAGTASMLTIFLPSGFGITEVTITALLGRLVPAGVAVLAALSARLLITLLDVIVGSLAYLAEMAQRAQ